MSDSYITPSDRRVGRRFKERRKQLRLTQRDMADALGVSFQQIQKYERGLNRIPATKLYAASHMLNVRMEYFFEWWPDEHGF